MSFRIPNLLVAAQLLLAGMSATTCESSEEPGPAPPVPSVSVPTTALAERVARIEHGLVSPLRIEGEPVASGRLEEQKEASRVPALALAIVDDCAVIWSGGWGTMDDGESPVTGQTPFQMGSVSKTVTATVAMTLVAAGKLGLDDPVNAHLRSWQLPEREAGRAAAVRLRHLLSHSAGLTRTGYAFDRGGPLPDIPSILAGRAGFPAVVAEEVPGVRATPSNSGYLVLQLLLDDVTGATLPELARERLFAPLGMAASAFEPVDEAFLNRAASGHRPDGTAIPDKAPLVPAAPGGLWSSAEDMGRLLAELMKSWQGRPGSLLPRDVARRMLDREVDDMGLGVHVRNRAQDLSFQQAGGGVGSQSRLVAYPEHCRGAAIVANTDRGGRLVAETLAAVGEEFRWPDLPLRVAAIELQPADLERVAGRYEYDASPGTVLTFTARGGNLFAQAGDQDPFPLRAVSETLFVAQRSALEIRFHLDVARAGDRATIGTAGFYGTQLSRID